MTPTISLKQLGLLGDFRLLVILFIAFRVMMLMVYQPLVIDNVERGVGAQGDRLYHYQLAELTKDGYYPFLDWWSEFPPVWYAITTTIYQSQGEAVDYGTWSIVLAMFVLLFEVGNLVLVRAIGSHLHGELTGMMLAWVYALLFAPIVFVFWNFESIVAFLLLLGVYFLLKGRDIRGGLAIGLGALTKFTPALIFGAVFRYYKPNRIIKILFVALGLFILVYALLFVNASSNNKDTRYVTTSLTAQFGKASYQTVWALLDGNYRTGNFGSVESHFDLAAADALYGNPPVIPSWLRLGVAVLIGLAVFITTRRFDDKGFVAFVTITVLIFFLQAQGWSPQWLAQIIPLVILCFPTKNGVLTSLILAGVTFIEYPVLFIRTGDTGGEITGALMTPFVVLVVLRTLILVALCVALYLKLRQEPIK
ncbi:MAG: glycosyltransferase 87 family protein [bacterium]|nr:glycosyltransferase 87 family protein [bacterium]